MKTGWQSFTTAPPDGELISVYAQNNEKYYWIVTCYWDVKNCILVECDGVFARVDNIRPLCWRFRCPEPRMSEIEKFRNEPVVETTDQKKQRERQERRSLIEKIRYDRISKLLNFNECYGSRYEVQISP